MAIQASIRSLSVFRLLAWLLGRTETQYFIELSPGRFVHPSDVGCTCRDRIKWPPRRQSHQSRKAGWMDNVRHIWWTEWWLVHSYLSRSFSPSSDPLSGLLYMHLFFKWSFWPTTWMAKILMSEVCVSWALLSSVISLFLCDHFSLLTGIKPMMVTPSFLSLPCTNYTRLFDKIYFPRWTEFASCHMEYRQYSHKKLLTDACSCSGRRSTSIDILGAAN